MMLTTFRLILYCPGVGQKRWNGDQYSSSALTDSHIPFAINAVSVLIYDRPIT